jgi:hypothetical protein
MISKKHLAVAAVAAAVAAVRVSRHRGVKVSEAVRHGRLHSAVSALIIFALILNWKSWPFMWHVCVEPLSSRKGQLLTNSS